MNTVYEEQRTRYWDKWKWFLFITLAYKLSLPYSLVEVFSSIYDRYSTLILRDFPICFIFSSFLSVLQLGSSSAAAVEGSCGSLGADYSAAGRLSTTAKSNFASTAKWFWSTYGRRRMRYSVCYEFLLNIVVVLCFLVGREGLTWDLILLGVVSKHAWKHYE